MNNPTSSTISVPSSEFAENTFDVSLMDPARMESIADRVSKMTGEQQEAWANTITNSIRDRVLNMAGKWYEFGEARQLAVETCQDAYAGGAWRILGYRSWAEYWKDKFSTAELFRSKDERNQLIKTLKDNNFSSRMIAPMVNMSYRGVAKVSNRLSASEESTLDGSENLVQVGTEFPPVQDQGESVTPDVQSSSDASKPEPAADTTPDEDGNVPLFCPAPAPTPRPAVKTKSLDGKEYVAPRSHDALIADWLWLKCLQDIKGMTLRAIETETGVPFNTVSRILRENEPTADEKTLIALKALRLCREQSLSQDEAAERLGLRPEALEWLLADENRPQVENLLDEEAYARNRSHDGMVADWLWMRSLKDLKAMTRRDIEALTGIPQTTVSRILREGEPTSKEKTLLALKALRLRREESLSRAAVANRMGLRLEALEWLLADENRPQVKDVIDRGCLLDQAYGGRLRLIDGSEQRQEDIAELCGVSQSMVSQTCTKLKKDYDLTVADHKRIEAEGGVNWQLPDNPSMADLSDHKGSQLESVYWREGTPANGYIPDAGPSQWTRVAEDEAMEFDPSMPESATPWYTAFAHCATDLFTHLTGPCNIVLNHPELIDLDSSRELLEALDVLRGVLDRGGAKLSKHLRSVQLQADLYGDDDDDDDYYDEEEDL